MLKQFNYHDEIDLMEDGSFSVELVTIKNPSTLVLKGTWIPHSEIVEEEIIRTAKDLGLEAEKDDDSWIVKNTELYVFLKEDIKEDATEEEIFNAAWENHIFF
jgi:hypothetical protein